MTFYIITCLFMASITFTICVTSIFKGFREEVSKIHPKAEELIHCPWCLSHWVTFVFLFLINFRIEASNYSILNFIFTLFSITGGVGIIHYVLLRAYQPIAEAMFERNIQKKRNAKMSEMPEENFN